MTGNHSSQSPQGGMDAKSISSSSTFPCVHELFETQAHTTPDAVAVELEGTRLTYRQLDERANKIARHLVARGVKPGSVVGISMGRSWEMIATLYGILKSGAAYAPLDPSYPRDRLAYMAGAAQLALLVTDEKNASLLSGACSAPLLIFEREWQAMDRLSEKPLPQTRHPDESSLIYVIYTSGSTGKPKGVAMVHRAIANLVLWQNYRSAALPESARTLQFTSLSFDVSAQEIFATTCSGGTLVLMREELRFDPVGLWNYLIDQRIHRLFLPFVALQQLAETAAESERWPEQLREVITAGEQLQITPKVRSLFQRLRIARLDNQYGPSETHVATAYLMPENPETWELLPPIGTAVADTHLLLLNEAGQVVGKGEQGELYIGGACLAQGYLHQPDLTAQRFITLPPELHHGTALRCYRTGDLAEWSAEGQLRFLGRADHQIKIRGYRVELGEVETVLSGHSGVRECVVTAEGQGPSLRLVAHVIPVTGASLSLPEIRNYLRDKLADYMLPSQLVVTERFPLTPSGKVDRRSLKAPALDVAADLPSPIPNVGSATGGSRLEPILRTAWSELLGHSQFGRDDVFFEVGGHSLLMAKLARKLQDQLGVEVPILSLFQHTTVASQATLLSRLQAGGHPEVQTRQKSLPRPAPDESNVSGNSMGIAIIGMSGRFPNSNSVGELWSHLLNREECITHFDDATLLKAGARPEDLQDPAYVRSRGVLLNPEYFDASFFGYNPKDAEVTDPQQRLFLECSWEAFETAGYVPDQILGRVGVYAGASLNTYFLSQVLQDGRNISEFTQAFQVDRYNVLVGNDKDYLATRVAYKLNLRGPAVTIQTACSTSLVAVIQACSALQSGLCDMALAGGVSVSFPQERGYIHEEGAIASSDGHCRAFDASATGTVFGAGTGVVLLKRLRDALRDGDPIVAVIRGVGLNNDGTDKVSFTAPSLNGQSEVISSALEQAGFDPGTVGMIEAHGTGTPLGDPIEVAALTQAFRKGTRDKNFCALGSIKTNVGHLEAAAGVTGLIKAALAVQQGVIPPTLHFKEPNPLCELGTSPFYVCTEAKPWPAGLTPRRAGISSFGVGGTNAHIVIEQAPERPVPECQPGPQILILSARTDAALDHACSRLAAELELKLQSSTSGSPSLADIAHTLQSGRKAFPKRRVVVASHVQEGIEKLRVTDPRKVVQGSAADSGAGVVFLFPGQGAQYVGMGQELYQSEKVFRASIDACAELFKPLLGQDLRELIYPESGKEEAASRLLAETRFTQPALFMTEWSLAELWISWGVQPVAVIGHSIGEYVAAVVAGSLTLKQAVELLSERARLMHSLPGGSMLAVRRGAQEVEKMLPPGTSIAALNSPNLCTVSGPTNLLQPWAAELEGQKIACKFLPSSHAFHSPMMDPILAPFTKHASQFPSAEPRIPWYSSCTGQRLTARDLSDGSYWARQLRQPVRFPDALAEVFKDQHRVFLECGPGQALSQFARQNPAKPENLLAVSPLNPPGNQEKSGERSAMLRALGALWCSGASVHWPALHAGAPKPCRVSLPTYPFERQRYWIESRPVMASGVSHSSAGTCAASEASTLLQELLTAQSQTLAQWPGLSPGAPLAPAPTPDFSVQSPPSMTPVERADHLAQLVRELIQELSGMQVPGDSVSFVELGLDSLFLTQASQALRSKFGIKITFRQLLDELSSVQLIATYLDKHLPVDKFQPPAGAAVSASTGSTSAASPIPPLQIVPPMLSNGAPSSPGGQSLLEQLVLQQAQTLQILLAHVRQNGSGSPIQLPLVPPASTGAPARPPGPGSGPAAGAPSAAMPFSTPEEAASSKTFGPYKGIDKSNDSGLTDRQQRYLKDFIQRYNQRTPKSKELTQRYRQWYADPRTASSFKRVWKEMVYQIVVEKSEGAYLWDIDGNQYIDLLNGFGPNFLGHSHPLIKEALVRQIDQGIEVGPQSPIAGETARLFCQLTGNERASFVNTGSEAVYAAMRLARTVTGKDKIVIFAKDYHGNFDEVLARAGGTPSNPVSLPIAPGIPRRAVQDMIILEYGSPRSLEIIRARADEIAAVMVEPVQSRRPELQPFQFNKDLRKLTQELEIALIFDEVITGVRHMPNGAQGLYGVQADIATYGKVVGGGMPIGIVAGKAEYMDIFDGGTWQYGDDSIPEKGATFFAGTFVRHPLAVVAMNAMMKYLLAQKPEFWDAINQRTTRLANTIDRYFAERQIPIQMPHCCSQMFLRVSDDLKYGNLLFYHLRQRGVFILEPFPSYMTAAHTDADIDKVIQAFKDSSEELIAEGFLTSEPGGKPPGGHSPRARDGVDAPAPGPVRSGTPASAELPGVQASRTQCPLTDVQREMWVAAQMQTEALLAQNASILFELDGPLNVPALHAAIQKVVARHDALRSTFSNDGTLIQIAKSVETSLPLLDLEKLPEKERNAARLRLIEDESVLRFDLEKGPLFSFRLIRHGAEKHELLFTINMIVCDGWSWNVVLEEISALYSGSVQGNTVSLKEPVPMGQYAEWLQVNHDSAESVECREFWKSRFESIPPPLNLPTSAVRPPLRTYDGSREVLVLAPSLVQDVKRVCKELGFTPFATLLGAFQTFLARITDTSDIVVGVPVAAQSALGWEGLVGQCANTLPFRCTIEADEPFNAFLKKTRDLIVDAQEHWNYTFSALSSVLDIPRDPSRLPLVSVLFNMDPPLSKVRFAGLQHKVHLAPRRYFQYDMGFNLVEEDGAIRVECDFNRNLFPAETVQRWLKHYQTLIENLVLKPGLSANELPILTLAERRQMLIEWNRTGVAPLPGTSVLKLFHDKVKQGPTTRAVTFSDRHLTYGELDQKSTQLANHLRNLGLKPGTLVALHLDRSLETVVAILGTWKASGAFVPLDPDLPAEVTREILTQLKPGFILTLSSLLPGLPDSDARLICLDEDWHSLVKENVLAPELAHQSEELAFISFTSGTTSGSPKAVEVSHGNLIASLVSLQKTIQTTERDVVLGLTKLSSDLALLETFLPLIVGGRLVVVPRVTSLDPLELAQLVEQNQVTVMQGTPTTWKTLFAAGWGGGKQLRALCGGEVLTQDLADQLTQRCSEAWALYGAAETTGWTLFHKLIPHAAPILGRPTPGNTSFILDRNLNPVPIGVPGELVIAGPQLARGYRYDALLTRTNLITLPFAETGTVRAFRTGDLARYTADGKIEYLGRKDDLLNLGGHTLSVHDIETEVIKDPFVRESAVCVRHVQVQGSSVERLVCYLALERSQCDVRDPQAVQQLKTRLKKQLSTALPAYMVPSMFMVLDHLPRTYQGKLDRRSLPTPDDTQIFSKTGFIAPRNETERKLAQIWSETLKIPEVGVHDNFFALGGQSLMALHLFRAIERELGRKLPLSTLFNAPTIAQLAQTLDQNTSPPSQWTSLVPIQPRGTNPPLFLVHGAGGNVLLYRALADRLAPEFPLYGLQAQGLDGQSNPLKTVEEMAQQYLREIRQIQPKGPYYLGGYCMGGTVAYEMAQRLHAEGETVGLVALLDTYEFSQMTKPTAAGLIRQKLKFHFRNLAQLKFREWPSYLASKLQIARDGELGAFWRSITGQNQGNRGRAPSATVEGSIQEINDHASEIYRPKPYAGRITLFKPCVNYDFYPDPNMGWGQLGLGGIEAIQLAANPHAMLVEPYVQELAVELTRRLRPRPSSSETAASSKSSSSQVPAVA